MMVMAENFFSKVYCPYCQLPLKLIRHCNLNLHIEVCSRKVQQLYVKECPKGLNCCSSMICHYERYSHNLLASSRANKNVDSENVTHIKTLLKCKLKTENDSSFDDFETSIEYKKIKRSKKDNIFKNCAKNKVSLKRRSTLLINKIVNKDDNSSSQGGFIPQHGLEAVVKTETLSNVEAASSDNINTAPNASSSSSHQDMALGEAGMNVSNYAIAEDTLHSDTDDSDSLLSSVGESLYENKTNHVLKLNVKTEKKKKQADIRCMLFKMKPSDNKESLPCSKHTPQEESSQVYNKKKRQCPFYKKIYGTDIAVDAFSYGLISGINFYFLSHFHYDHYMGLNKQFKANVYCSHITGNLVEARLRLPGNQIKRLPMNTSVKISNTEVTFLEANHCPGAVLMIFKLCNGQTILHTGDFRADDSLQSKLKYYRYRFDTIYLDTTYLNPSYCFPSQSNVVEFVGSEISRIVKSNPRTLVVTGTYCIGKEKIFLGIAKKLDCLVYVSNDKFKTLTCLDNQEINNMLTKNIKETNLHVLLMRQINVSNLRNYLDKFGGVYSQIVAVKPTGWTHKGVKTNLRNLQPFLHGSVIMYEVPYSEHSSFLELKEFVEALKPRRVIPTVNIGKPESRKMMESYIDKWKK